MLIDLIYLVKKYKMQINGILHIGAHRCEEEHVYKKVGVSENNIIWVEANPNIVNELKNKYKNLYQGLMTDKDNDLVEFNISNNYESSSIFDLNTHLKHHPNIYYTDKITLKTKTIKTFFNENQFNEQKYNFLNMDIQGAELLALKGMENLLENFDYLYLEVNKEQLYKNCCIVDEIDEYLRKYNFKRIETKFTKYQWGDALYIKQK